ncbi:hypothetical protein [Vibrio sp. 10N.286.49.B3]|nr:hypothetical protein [Vibrio sp. 10N.286.49.B3]
MNHDLGSVFLAQALAKKMMHEAMYGKPAPKKVSLFKRVMKKIAR